MTKVTLSVPSMYADHHVTAVREVLTRLEGVSDVYASSTWQQVVVSYDAKKIKPKAIEKALAEAGYPVGGERGPQLAQRGEKEKDPAWDRLGVRVTETNRADIEMSGEFRKY